MEEKSIIIVPEKVSWNDERVLTTAQLAEYYECTPENIRDNFRKNVDRFVEGKHFFKLEGDALEKLRAESFRPQISAMTRVLYLWTKRGAARMKKARFAGRFVFEIKKSSMTSEFLLTFSRSPVKIRL